MSAPKLFISYSWSSPEHEQWVLDLATNLQESGVDVIFDKWDLKEGHDAIAFMEKMVTDPKIKKVAMIIDKKYALKADGREGGVVTETQIISKEVYEKQSQDKFVAVVTEKDEDGKAYLPTYYKSRIYIDLSQLDTFNENFEKLLRWIFDKPLNVKPELGTRPSFLDDDKILLGTNASFKLAINAIKKGEENASGNINEYLTIFSENLEKFRINDTEDEIDDEVIKSIEKFIPYRNEAIKLFITISQYSPSEENVNILHRFFEDLIPYMCKPEHISSYKQGAFDNFIFIIHELFLYLIASLIRFERFDVTNKLLEQGYYAPDNPSYHSEPLVGYYVLRDYMHSLDRRNTRLKLRRMSLRSDLLHQRANHSIIKFSHLMQADFILFLRAEIEGQESYFKWMPYTLLYLRHIKGPFEVFARAVSKKYFNKVISLLGIDDIDELKKLTNDYCESKRALPQWGTSSINPGYLLGINKLATKP